MQTRTLGSALLALLIMTACGEDEDKTVTVEKTPAPLVTEDAVIRRVTLPEVVWRPEGAEEKALEAVLVGVAVEPETERTVVLLEASDVADNMLFEVDEGVTQWRIEDALWAGDANAFDIAALGDGVFALSSIAEGSLLNLNIPRLEARFCYEPACDSRSYSIAYDRESGLLYTQRNIYGYRPLADQAVEPTSTLISAYTNEGTEVAKWPLSETTFATGMVVLESRPAEAPVLLLVQASKLYRFDGEAWIMTPIADLSGLGEGTIVGLAWGDSARKTLVVALKRYQPYSAELVTLDRNALLP